MKAVKHTGPSTLFYELDMINFEDMKMHFIIISLINNNN